MSIIIIHDTFGTVEKPTLRSRYTETESVHVVEARRRHPCPLNVLHQLAVVGCCSCCGSRCGTLRDLLLVDLVVDQLSQRLLGLEEGVKA